MQDEMTLRELLGTICARWRMLVALAVVFAVLLGGYRTYSGIKSLGDETAIDKAQETNRIERQLYESKKEMLLQEIAQLELQSEQANNYNENSLLMRVDPYNKQVASVSFCVNADMAALAKEVPEAWQFSASTDLKAERVNRIANQYLILANGVSLGELMADTAYQNMADQYLRELVSITNNEQGILTIEAITTEQVDGMELANRIYEYCHSKQSDVAAAAGEHAIELVSADSIAKIDLELGKMQLEAQALPTDISVQISDKTKELKELAEPAPVTTATIGNTVKGGVKYAVLGAVVGALMGAVIAFFLETMSIYFKNASAMAQATSCRYLGNLKPCIQKRGLDAWAEKLLGEDVFSTVATEDRLPLIAANIKEAADGKRKLLITGMRPQSELDALTSELQKQLGDEYKLIAAANLLINAEAIRQLKSVEGVVMVENEKTAQIERVMNAKQYLDEVKSCLVGVVWA